MSATNRNYNRHPKTGNERRQSADKDYLGLIRAARKSNNLPDSYDDIPIPHRVHKCWENRRGNAYLTPDCKLINLEIRGFEGFTTIQNLFRIEAELERLDYSYNRQYKILDNEAFYIVSYRGRSIGDFKGVKYV